jgi:hypothetical protein
LPIGKDVAAIFFHWEFSGFELISDLWIQGKYWCYIVYARASEK